MFLGNREDLSGLIFLTSLGPILYRIEVQNSIRQAFFSHFQIGGLGFSPDPSGRPPTLQEVYDHCMQLSIDISNLARDPSSKVDIFFSISV